MKMTDHDNQRLQKFYNDGLDLFGLRDSSMSVRWSSRRDQEDRFKALLFVGDLTNSSLLDVGCGLGDLYKYILRHELELDYTGIDIVPRFINEAKKRFPQAKFLHQDIMDTTQHFDYVIASGALTFKVADHHQYYRTMIAKMYSLANRAVAFNMLDIRSHIDDATFAAYDINQIVEYCSTLANRVETVTDYVDRDFTVFMYK